ncbi:MAG: sugar phosphate isomerase/epimerase family protein [Thermoguttaceae bacterium]
MLKPLGWIALTLFPAAFAASGLLAGDVGTSKSFHGPVGLVSPYSLRDLQKSQGLAAALDKTQSFGFRYVEFGADFGGLKPAAFKAELDRRGLVPVGLHFSYEQIRDDVEAAAATAKLMNVSYIGCAWIPHKDPFDEEQCRAAAAVFNRAGAALAKHGIQLYYHTHGYEFRPLGQGTVFDLLVTETSPKTLMFEMDVAWVALPGQDPAELLKKYPDRWLLMHVKDLKKGVPQNHLVKAALTDQVPIGSGQIDWPKVLCAAQEAGVKYYLIEDESPAVLEQIPQSLRYLESVSW